MGDQSTHECGWVTYEKLIYDEVVYAQKRDRIADIIGSCVNTNDLPRGWPGSIRIANAIMKEIWNV